MTEQNTQPTPEDWGSSTTTLPASKTPNYAEMKRTTHAVRTNSMVIAGDIETPDHDHRVLEAIIEIAYRYHIDLLGLNGDFFSHDALSPHRPDFPIVDDTATGIKVGVEILNILGGVFKEVFLGPGNHDRRPQHATNGQICTQLILEGKLKPNIRLLTFPELHLTTCGPDGHGPDQEWLVAHQDNYSRVPLSVPRELVQIYHKHIVCAHNHRLAIGRDKGNRFWLIEGGHCRDEERTLYKQARVNTHPNWVAGFVYILDGVPWLVDKHNYRQHLKRMVSN